MNGCVQVEEEFTIKGNKGIILTSMYKLEPSNLNGRQRCLYIAEDITQKRKMEEKLEKKRKKIERMDDHTKILMKFFDHSPLIMASVYTREDDLEFKLLNPANL